MSELAAGPAYPVAARPILRSSEPWRCPSLDPNASTTACTASPVVAGVTAVIAVLNLLLFPFAREMCFRSTAPIREGLAGMMVFGWLFLVVVVCRIAMFLVIWAVSIPAGLISLRTLGDEDRRGLGWRIS